MSSGDYLYVGKRDGRYLIVRRSTRATYPDRIQPSEVVLADSTNARTAVREADKLAQELRIPGETVAVQPTLSDVIWAVWEPPLTRMAGWLNRLLASRVR